MSQCVINCNFLDYCTIFTKSLAVLFHRVISLIMNEHDENLIMALERSQLELHETTSGNNNESPRLSPVQIQQEYFENLPECDWVK